MFFIARWARASPGATGQQFPTVSVGLALIVGLPSLVFLFSGSPLSWDNPALGGFNFRGGLVVIPELAALTLALSIYTAAFIAEAVRSGIQAVSHGQTEAAYALGLRPRVTLRLVIIPQAMRVIIPQLTSQYLNLTKNSSLATAIGYPDLVAVFAGTTLNQTGQAVEVIAMTMGVYLMISLVDLAVHELVQQEQAAGGAIGGMSTHTPHPDLPPPLINVGVIGWLRTNLFSSWANTLLTLVSMYLIYLMIPPLIDWAFLKADWVGDSREACTAAVPAGCSSACASTSSCTASTRRASTGVSISRSCCWSP